MSIENAARLVRFMEKDAALRDKVMSAGNDKFEQITAEAGASCTAYQVVQSLTKQMAQT